MKFIVLKKGESLADLAGRIATRKGAPPQERTLAALRDANPKLAELETRPAPADTVVVLPTPLAGTSAEREQPTLPETLLDSVLANLDTALASLANVLELEEQEAAAAVGRIRSADVEKWARTEPELQQELAGVQQRAAGRAERAKIARAAQSTLSQLIGEDVATLRKAVLERSAIASALNEIEPPEEPPPDRRPPTPRDPTGTPGGGRTLTGPAGKTVVGQPPGGTVGGRPVGGTVGGQTTGGRVGGRTTGGRVGGQPADKAVTDLASGKAGAGEPAASSRKLRPAGKEGATGASAPKKPARRKPSSEPDAAARKESSGAQDATPKASRKRKKPKQGG